MRLTMFPFEALDHRSLAINPYERDLEFTHTLVAWAALTVEADENNEFPKFGESSFFSSR